MLMFLSLLLLSVIDGVPLMKMHDSELLNVSIEDSGLMNDIMSSKNNHKALLSIISEADPAKLNAVVALVRELLETSKSELEGLTTNSDNADVAYSNAVIAHETAIGAYDQGVIELKTAYDQGVSALQAVVDAAKGVKDTSSATKNTANGVLAAEKSRLESEISTLTDIIALIEGLNPGCFCDRGCLPEITKSTRSIFTKAQLGLNTFSFASGSLERYCSVSAAADSDTVMSGIHCFTNINNGVYGNANSWIPGVNGFVGFRLDDSNEEYFIEGFCVSRDNTGSYKDRSSDQLTFGVTTDDNANLGSNWCDVGSIKRKGVSTELCYTFAKPIKAKAVRISTTYAGTCIDEFQIFGSA